MSFKGLDNFVTAGQSLLDKHDPAETHRAFNLWVSEVAQWLTDNHPDTFFSEKWMAQADSNLVIGGGCFADPSTWSIFRKRVQDRLRWLGELPMELKIARMSALAKVHNLKEDSAGQEIKHNTSTRTFVDADRIDQIKAIKDGTFDLTKLVRLCEELNMSFEGGCYLSMIMLTRAILYHVPPIFGCYNFLQVANDYSGEKSFRESMLHLENSSREISNYYLRSQITGSEPLPSEIQIDYLNDIDLLLSEVVRLLAE